MKRSCGTAHTLCFMCGLKRTRLGTLRFIRLCSSHSGLAMRVGLPWKLFLLTCAHASVDACERVRLWVGHNMAISVEAQRGKERGGWRRGGCRYG